MPQQRQVTENYIGICYYNLRIHINIWFIKINKTIRIPYLCIKQRTVTKWCYVFEQWNETCVGVVGLNTACENGRKYTWKDFCLGIGSIGHIPQEKCFDEPLEDKGPCDIGSTVTPPSIPGPDDPTYSGPISSGLHGEHDNQDSK